MNSSLAEHELATLSAMDGDESDSAAPSTPGAPVRDTQDLAEIMTAFTQVTDRLQGAHHILQGEVRRLNHELRETNEQLRRSRQLAALGQMAAGIAHEIRNPLASIRLYASMLAEDLTDRPDSSRLAQQIARAIRDLDAVVGDVLNFARELKLRPAPTSVAALFDHALEACRGLLHESQIHVSRDPEVEAALTDLHVDSALFNQALVNLLRNAIEAMSSRGTLTLSAAMDPAGAETIADESSEEDRSFLDGPMMRLVVDDTGPGIPQEIVERIFNPFFTTRHTGTGLGLAIVHRIIDAHGGDIQVGRNARGGASIALRVPVASARPVDAGLAASHHDE